VGEKYDKKIVYRLVEDNPIDSANVKDTIPASAV